MTKLYIAHAMSGRTGRELLAESRKIRRLCKMFNCEPIDPVIEEGVRKDDPCVGAPSEKLVYLWERDKELIRRSHVLLDLTGSYKSEGVAHEIGYARYYMWKPVVRVYPGLGPSVARLEDDYIAMSPDIALRLIVKEWGTPWRRTVWKLGIINRSLLRFLKRQVADVINGMRG